MIRNKLFFLIFFFICNSTYALSKLHISSIKDTKTYFLDKESMRLGNGVLGWYMSESNYSNFVLKHFHLCNGKEMKLNIQNPTHTFEKDYKNEEIYKYILSQSVPTHLSAWLDTQNIDAPYAKYGNLVCKIARPESEGELFPIAKIKIEKSNTMELIAIMSGTFSKQGRTIEGWLKTYRVDLGGKNPNGSLRWAQEKKDGHELTQVSIDCINKTYDVIRFVKYDKSQQPVASHKYKSDPETPIPGTVGATWILEICKIYN